MADSDNRMTYDGYLRIQDLLSLQDGPQGYMPKPCNNEMHFIVVHQAFELWFKVILREFDEIHKKMSQDVLPEQTIPELVHHFSRCTSIMKLMAGQWDVMQTLSPQEFLSFRHRLGTSSGFESWQMRAIELRLGLKNQDRVQGMDPMAHFEKLMNSGSLDKKIYDELVVIQNSPSIADLLRQWLARTPVDGNTPTVETMSKFIQKHIQSMQEQANSAIEHMVSVGMGEEETLRARFEMGIESARDFLKPSGEVDLARAGLLFIESYKDLPLLSWPRRLLDEIVAFEQSMLHFRSHHARMVERMIGRRIGTGGSSGVDYLDQTVKYRVFEDLWKVRTILIRPDALPELSKPEYYDFADQT